MDIQPNLTPNRISPISHKRRILGGFLLAIVIALIASNTYLYYLRMYYLDQGALTTSQSEEQVMQMKLKREQSPSTSSGQSAIPSNWKTYTNTQYGFEFKYPSQWPTPKETQDNIFIQGDLGPVMKGACEGTDCYPSGFSVTSAPLSAFGSDALETPERLLKYLSSSGDKVVSDLTNNNVRTIIWGGTGGMGGTYTRIDIFRPAINRTFHIQFWTVGDVTILNQILSTFRFTNSSSGIYDIKDLGVQFTLPTSLSDLQYHWVRLGNDQAVNSVEFSSDKLIAAGCNLDKAPLGYLTYDTDQGGSVVGYARGSNLYYIPPKTQCGDSLQNWQTLQEALKSLVTDYVQ